MNQDLAGNTEFVALLQLVGDTCSVAAINPLLWAPEQVLLFRDFWICAVMVGLSAQCTWPQAWIGILINIARASPPLVVPETLVSLDADLSSNSVLRRKIPEEVTTGRFEHWTVL
jgi:hypothetical protein